MVGSVHLDVTKLTVAHDVRARSAFFGRESELAEIEAHWAAGARIVSLLGAPGIGKTRLALHHLAERAPSDAALFLDLSAARDARDVFSALARLLEVSTRGNDESAIVTALAQRGLVLLVLDECEGAAPAVAATLTRLHGAAAKTRFLVTSRERLGVPGERIVVLPPLSAADAVDLFVDRALRARPSFTTGQADAAHVLSIVRALDGVPLAIELAAARASVLDCATIHARLDDRFALLRSRDNVGPRASRHQTLRAAIDASWFLLAADEQRVLARCAVFRGAFDITAAEAVMEPCAVEGGRTALDVLQALVDKSLVVTHCEEIESGSRIVFRLLESIREYAESRLAKDEAEQAFQRHAEYHLAAGRNGVRPVGEPVLELHAIHARGLARSSGAGRSLALRASAALESHYFARGPLREYLLLLDQAIDNVEHTRGSLEDHSLDLARGLCIRGRVRRLVSVSGVEDDLDEALRLARSHSDAALEARALLDSAEALMGSHPTLAQERFAEARALHRRLGAVDGECKALGGLGAVAVHLGDLPLATKCFEEGLACARGTPGGPCDLRQEGLHLGNLGALHHMQGHLAEARIDYQAAFAVARRRGDDRVAAVQLGNLGLLLQEEGATGDARSHLEEGLSLAMRVGDLLRVGVLRGLLGLLAYEQNDLATARGHLQEAIRVLAGTPEGRRDRWIWLFTAGLGGVEALLGRPSEGRSLLEAAEREIRTLEDPMLLCAWTIHAAAIDVAEARAILGGLQEDSRAAARDARDAGALSSFARAQRRVATAVEQWRGPHASDDARTASRILARHLGAAGSGPPMLVGFGGLWFRPPGGARVDLTRREVAARLLDALCRAREESPGCPLAVPELLSAGWPGERVLARAGASRVYVAMGSLRKLGLGKNLARVSGGYFLDPSLTLLTTKVRRLAG